LRDSEGQTLDKGLVLFFQAPNSFTGEDSAELHLHGGKAVVAAVLTELAALEGVRLADPGEYTLRAFLNGKLDLIQAEALADLIEAETEAQRRSAVRNTAGAQSELYQNWRRQLIHVRAMIEAEMDFSDEADVSSSFENNSLEEVRRLAETISAHIGAYRRAEIIRDGYDVVIIGAPNAGKSSLLNALARRDVAIVSDEPGTTRDLVEVSLNLNGYKVRLTDTAGLRDGAGTVERIGIEKATAKAHQADLVLHLVDASSDSSNIDQFPGVDCITVGSKSDLLPNRTDGLLLVSSLTGSGINYLLDLLGRRAAEAVGATTDILPSQLRHVELLNETLVSLQNAAVNGIPQEIRAEHLRHAANSLGRISGSVDVEDLLDVIFSRFCIGK
jgi:tRNA modification GTPase